MDETDVETRTRFGGNHQKLFRPAVKHGGGEIMIWACIQDILNYSQNYSLMTVLLLYVIINILFSYLLSFYLLILIFVSEILSEIL